MTDIGDKLSELWETADGASDSSEPRGQWGELELILCPELKGTPAPEDHRPPTLEELLAKSMGSDV
jgi:hypothetical protein